MDFGYYLKVFVRRLPYFLVLFLLGTAIGLTLAVMLPPVYRAEAKLIVETEQIPGDLAPTTVRTGEVEQLQIVQQRIQTREVLLEMANRLGIYANTGRAPMTADAKIDDLRKRISINITGGDGRRGPRRAMLVLVGFEAETARMAAQVANEVVTLILQQNVEMRTTVSGQTLDFFSQEVERLSRELDRQSAALLKFQEENLSSLPDSLEFRRSKQAAQQERLLQLQRGESVLRDRRERLVTMFETTGQVAAEAGKPQTPEAQQLQQLKREYSSLVAVLAPSNPKVALLKSRVDALEEIVAQQKGLVPDGEGGEAPSAYEIQLADIDTQLEYIAEQKVYIEKTLEDLQASIEKTPANSVTLEALQREYDNTRARYNQAVAKQAQAELGDTIESLSKGQRISVLEQATPPREPTSPNRPVIAAAGVGGGLALGLGFVLLLELLNASVRRPVDLTKKLGITAFGTVPYIWTGPQLFRRRAIIAGVFIFILVGIPAGLWVIDTQITPLQPLVGRILDRLNIPLAADLPIIASTRFS
ncbi:MAG: GumC family protein [Pseudooceanicola nanhaiensis]